MRGFVFSVDAVLGALAVLLMLAFLAQSFQSPSLNPQVVLQLSAKDAALAWFYGASYISPTISDGTDYACETAFRPRVTNDPLDPTNASGTDYVIQTVCVVSP